MKIVRYSIDGKTAFGVWDAGRIAPLTSFGIAPVGTLAELAALDAEGSIAKTVAAAPASAWETAIPEERVRILAPCERPPHDVICVGVNYRAHREEFGGPFRDYKSKTVFFGKRCDRMTGPGEAIKFDPALDDTLDYEVELAVIIGKGGKKIAAEDAAEHIFGYSVFNDVSLRTTQTERAQWLLGKGADTFCVMGPCVLLREGTAFPPVFPLRSFVNGEPRQSSDTSLLIAGVAELIADVSSFTTLEPGDIIATGTPGGVGKGFDPKKYMKDGDTVKCEIPDIGTLENPIKAI